MIHVAWQRYFDPLNPCGMDVAHGELAGMQRCQRLLEDMGVEAVTADRHERPYCLAIDDIASKCYLQNGYFTARAGDPDFFWIDTMWDKM